MSPTALAPPTAPAPAAAAGIGDVRVGSSESASAECLPAVPALCFPALAAFPDFAAFACFFLARLPALPPAPASASASASSSSCAFLPRSMSSGRRPSRASPSTSMLGRMRSIHFGIHHVARPSRNIDAGISVMRTTKASNRTAAPRAKPKTFTNANGWPMNATKTEIMMIAAAVTTRAPNAKPSTTDSSTPLYGEPGRDLPPECV